MPPPPPFRSTAQWPGMELGLPASGPGSLATQGGRLVAQIIDDVIVGLTSFVLSILVGVLFTTTVSACGGRGCTSAVTVGFFGGFFLGLVLFGLIGVLYEPLITARMNATLGMRAMSIRVHRLDNVSTLGYGKAFGRSAVKWLPGVIPGFGFIFQLVNFAWCLWDKNRQCLHDKAVNTIVVNVH